jgi:O-antigen ligase
MDERLAKTEFYLIAALLILAPWLFGAWEMWWFWPCALALFAATFVLGLRFLQRGTPALRAEAAHRSYRAIVFLQWAYVPFLVYAFIRFLQAPVFLDAQRSFLLFFTPFLLGLHILFGFDARQRSALFWTLTANLCALGLYGILNHWIDGSRRVLWRAGYEQYAGRATGSFFCPDHYAGIMELAVCMGIALVTDRRRDLRMRLWGLIPVAIGGTGVVMSQSRGGGLTLVAIAAATVVWGLGQWPARRRWILRSGVVAILVLTVAMLWGSRHPYAVRFREYGAWRRIERVCELGGGALLLEDVKRTSRGRMIGGALRAWRSAPVFGIGPGMHQHVWFHFGPGPDGDRATARWPVLVNTDFHSYEVHSDWVQLLEEYGVVGFALFLIPALALFLHLQRALRRETRRRREAEWQSVPGENHDRLLTGLLAWVCMAFHSLGDFNLQIPAIGWTLAALLALSLKKRRKEGPASA